MRRGVILAHEGGLEGWSYGDPTTSYPGEHPIAAGDEIVDLSALTETEASEVIRFLIAQPSAERIRWLQTYPHVTIPTLPAPRDQWAVRIQPGFRRIVHCPSAKWHTSEMAARIRANARFAEGYPRAAVISEFTHLDNKERQRRMIELVREGRFSLTPLVELKRHADGRTERTYPWQETMWIF